MSEARYKAGDRVLYFEDGKECRDYIHEVYPNYDVNGTMYLVETEYDSLWPVWENQIIRKVRRYRRQ